MTCVAADWSFPADNNFEKDGFVILGKLLSDSGLDEVRKTVDGLITGKNDRVSEEWMMNLHQVGQNWLWELGTHPKILDAVEKLLGTSDILLFSTQIYSKAPQKSKPTPWHQDGSVMCTLWLSLDEVSPDNGGLCMKPNWFKKERLPHGMVDHELGIQIDFKKAGIDYDEWLKDCVWYNLSPGEAAIHHATVPHFSKANETTDKPRRVIILRYLPATETKSSGSTYHYHPENGRMFVKKAFLVRGKDVRDQGYETEPGNNQFVKIVDGKVTLVDA
eukprot:TRINITY_DN68156_c5_g9_i1.p1 TRINITY_DN68156_c5_g9~~TRINITY_DN68156_c5_g9_i1.p1  ORF type:complete len:291 (-),score=16.98 TRINITY_DN68156_c5_g9_i1:96-920(-)